ncbi:MAG: hypothetical protein AVDCRST_MAG93-4180 [uncultured Chloroflexia bacterium]|uniref:Uncharacterized protein n=1 Tax=uncultured Chloroflexia bacterium TaxID=1672391 RepID=A0A6J4K3F4_9CHLR|nr:MAG: hypothetical protein AVDCRST_MAG93-4180 [uncultured Chloroflexia bacterium]
MHYLPHGLGALLVEGSLDSLGTRGAWLQDIQAALVEVVDGVSRRLLPAAQVPGYLWDPSPLEPPEVSGIGAR